MSLYEVVGSIYIILMVCIGTALVAGLAVLGAQSLQRKYDLGKFDEENAVRDWIPGVRK